MTASLRILSSKADSNTWESFTRSGLKLKSVHQESPRWDVFRKRATKPLLNLRQVRSILPGLRRKNRMLLSGPKSSFQMKVNLFFIGNQGLESGGRVERHRIHVAWSPVWSLHSQWWFGVLWRRLVLVHCVLSSPKSCSHYQGILEHFMLLSADKLYGDADFLFQQDFSTCTQCQTTSKCFADHDITVLDWPANMPDLNPMESMGYFQEKDEKQSINNPDDWRLNSASTVPQADRFHATPHWCWSLC